MISFKFDMHIENKKREPQSDSPSAVRKHTPLSCIYSTLLYDYFQVFHFFITFRNDVVRSFLRFIIGLREVLPHDADAEQLNRADEDDHTHGGCPAGDRIAEAQASDNDDDQHDRCHDIAASNLGFEFNVRHQASH